MLTMFQAVINIISLNHFNSPMRDHLHFMDEERKAQNIYLIEKQQCQSWNTDINSPESGLIRSRWQDLSMWLCTIYERTVTQRFKLEWKGLRDPLIYPLHPWRNGGCVWHPWEPATQLLWGWHVWNSAALLFGQPESALDGIKTRWKRSPGNTPGTLTLA